MDGWKDGWMHGCMDAYRHARTYVCMHMHANACTCMHVRTWIKPRHLFCAHRDANNDRQNPCPPSRCVRRSRGHLCPEEKYNSSAACFGHSWTEWSKSSRLCHRPRGSYTPPAGPFEKDLQSSPGRQCAQTGSPSAELGSSLHPKAASPRRPTASAGCPPRLRAPGFPPGTPPGYSWDPRSPPGVS